VLTCMILLMSWLKDKPKVVSMGWRLVLVRGGASKSWVSKEASMGNR
jgi:hypothetical protein